MGQWKVVLVVRLAATAPALRRTAAPCIRVFAASGGTIRSPTMEAPTSGPGRSRTGEHNQRLGCTYRMAQHSVAD